jgi:hypothetical protein
VFDEPAMRLYGRGKCVHPPQLGKGVLDYGWTERDSVSPRTRDSSSCGLNGFVT